MGFKARKKDPVFTLTYDHRHGVDTMVFASRKAAMVQAMILIGDEVALEDISGDHAKKIDALLKDGDIEGALKAFNALRGSSSRASAIDIEETRIIG